MVSIPPRFLAAFLFSANTKSRDRAIACTNETTSHPPSFECRLTDHPTRSSTRLAQRIDRRNFRNLKHRAQRLSGRTGRHADRKLSIGAWSHDLNPVGSFGGAEPPRGKEEPRRRTRQQQCRHASRSCSNSPNSRLQLRETNTRSHLFARSTGFAIARSHTVASFPTSSFEICRVTRRPC